MVPSVGPRCTGGGPVKACQYVYIYIYIYVHIYLYVYIYIYIHTKSEDCDKRVSKEHRQSQRRSSEHIFGDVTRGGEAASQQVGDRDVGLAAAAALGQGLRRVVININELLYVCIYIYIHIHIYVYR